MLQSPSGIAWSVKSYSSVQNDVSSLHTETLNTMNDQTRPKMVCAWFVLLCCASPAMADPPLLLHCTASGSFGWVKYDISVNFDQKTVTVYRLNSSGGATFNYAGGDVEITQSRIVIRNRYCAFSSRGQCDQYEDITYLIDRMDGSFSENKEAQGCNREGCRPSWTGTCAVATQSKF